MDSHARSLREETGDEKLVQGILSGYSRAPIEKRTLSLLRFAEKLTNQPKAQTQEDLTALRKEGYRDEEILDLVHVVAYFNYINRVANALGVDPEPR